MVAPASMAHVAVAIDAARRSGAGSGVPVALDRLPRKLLRLVPTRTGSPVPTIVGRPRSSDRLWAAVLPKPMPGSIHTSPTPASRAARALLHEEALHVGHDVAVAGMGLHGARRPLHVHGHPPRTAGQRHRPQRRRDVVHQGGPGAEGGLGHRRLDGVHRHPHVRRQRLHHGRHPAQLLGLGHGLGPRTARFAAHVHDVGPLAHHGEAVLDGPVGVEVPATVGERVGGHVQHPHDERPHGRRLRPGGRPVSDRGRTPWPPPGCGGRLGTALARPR